MTVTDYRFARSPRWLATHLLVVALVVGMVALGFWQLRRLDERRDRNSLISDRLVLPRVPVDDAVASAGGDVGALRFRPVTVDGQRVATASVRTTQGGAPGFHVLEAVDLEHGGEGVVVLAGFVAAEEDGAGGDGVDAVAVEGVAIPLSRTSRPIEREVDRLAADTGLALLPVIVQATAVQPPRTPVPLPEQDEGPHLSYAVQWFLFAGVVATGYPLLLRRRARESSD